MKIKMIMVGAQGRMGQTILRLAKQNPDFEVAGEVDMGDNLASVVNKADVVIDFSHHSATVDVAQTTAKAGKTLVIGTTGHSDAAKKAVLDCGKQIPLIFASNYAVGVNILFYLTRHVAEVIGDSFDQEIIEMHHRMKKDAPSGTAKTLAEILCEVQGRSYADDVRHGRVGEPGERTKREIGMHALRGGDVAGDHTVIFAADGERLELTYRASSRDAFATGALRAAKWLIGKPAGVYSMFDVLGLK
ncbi:MAG: 4-hydroxy-tetrahydrodipicolinate reductase [bacterium]